MATIEQKLSSNSIKIVQRMLESEVQKVGREQDKILSHTIRVNCQRILDYLFDVKDELYKMGYKERTAH